MPRLPPIPEGNDLGQVHVHAHQSRAFHVVPGEVDVRAEAVPVQEEPHYEAENDCPDELHRDDAADLADDGRIQDRALDVGHAHALPVREDHHAAPPEELGADGGHKRRDADLRDDHAVDEARRNPAQDASQ